MLAPRGLTDPARPHQLLLGWVLSQRRRVPPLRPRGSPLRSGEVGNQDLPDPADGAVLSEKARRIALVRRGNALGVGRERPPPLAVQHRVPSGVDVDVVMALPLVLRLLDGPLPTVGS